MNAAWKEIIQHLVETAPEPVPTQINAARILYSRNVVGK